MRSRSDGNVESCHAESAPSETGLGSSVGIDPTSALEASCSFSLDSRMKNMIGYVETTEVQAVPVQMGAW